MPVLDWDSSRSAFKPGFKYYWAIKIPSTFVWSLVLLLSWRMLLPWKDSGSDKSLIRTRDLDVFLANDSFNSLVDE